MLATRLRQILEGPILLAGDAGANWFESPRRRRTPRESSGVPADRSRDPAEPADWPSPETPADGEHR